MPKKYQLFLLAFLLIPCLGIGLKPGGDLNVYHSAAEWIATGQVARLYRDNAEIGNFFYGPVAFTFLAPFGHLTLPAMNWIWLTLQTVAYVSFWFLLSQIFPSLFSGGAFVFLICWIASIKPIHASFQSHNVQLMFAAVLLVAEIWSRGPNRKRQIAAGAFVALLASIKIYPGFIAVYYLLRRPAGVRWGLALGGALVFLIPMATFGPSLGIKLPFEFVHNAVTYHHVYDLAHDTVSLSLPSLLARWVPETWSFVSWLVIAMTGLGFFYESWRTRGEAETRQKYRWALALAMMGLLNSTSRPDYFIFFVPAFCALAELIGKKAVSSAFNVGLFASLALIAFITDWTLQNRELTHQLEGWRVPVLGILLLCFLLARALSTPVAFTTMSKYP